MVHVAAALRDGANVIATARNLDRLQGAVGELDPGGERTLAMTADIMDSDRAVAAVSAGVERFGGLDGVVNVAAYDAVMGTSSTWTPTPFARCSRSMSMNAPTWSGLSSRRSRPTAGERSC